jgi:hypothetical protein
MESSSLLFMPLLREAQYCVASIFSADKIIWSSRNNLVSLDLFEIAREAAANKVDARHTFPELYW